MTDLEDMKSTVHTAMGLIEEGDHLHDFIENFRRNLRDYGVDTTSRSELNAVLSVCEMLTAVSRIFDDGGTFTFYRLVELALACACAAVLEGEAGL